MDAAELIDPRPSDDAPLAFWHDRLVLSVHHDGADAMTAESKIITDGLVHRILFGGRVAGCPTQAFLLE
jgi:hypothetical protein